MAKRKGKLNGWRFVEILWNDSVSQSKWHSLAESPNVAQIRSRGWLVKGDKKQVVVSATYGDYNGNSDDLAETTAIPRGCIISITDLKV